MSLVVKTSDGKYTVVFGDDGHLRALRYGKPWRDCLGDGLILTLAQDINELREELKTAAKYLAEGKRLFTPNTTNSHVDEFIKKHHQEIF